MGVAIFCGQGHVTIHLLPMEVGSVLVFTLKRHFAIHTLVKVRHSSSQFCVIAQVIYTDKCHAKRVD